MTRIICEHSPLCKLFRSKFLSTIVLFYILQSSSSTNIPCGKSFVPCIIDDRRKFLKVIADNYSLNRKSTIIGDVTSSTSPTSRLIVNAPSIPFFMMQSAVNDAKTKVDNLIKQIEQELVFSTKNNGIFWEFIQKYSSITIELLIGKRIYLATIKYTILGLLTPSLNLCPPSASRNSIFSGSARSQMEITVIVICKWIDTPYTIFTEY